MNFKLNWHESGFKDASKRAADSWFLKNDENFNVITLKVYEFIKLCVSEEERFSVNRFSTSERLSPFTEL